MRLPIIEGLIRRRILINFQIDPEIVSKFLPPAFSPKIVKGKSIIGICLIRLENIRPKSFPMNLGIHSENVAHRIAVNWTDETGILREGVYIFRRDSNSWLNTLFGGRLFPGEHNQAQFFIDERTNYIDILVRSNDTKVKIHARGLLQKNTLR